MTKGNEKEVEMQKRTVIKHGILFMKSQLAQGKDKLRIRKTLIRIARSMAVKLGQ
jgi:hypothetical protein